MLINNPVAIEVEEIVDELIFTESNVEDLLIGAGVAVGMVEVKTNDGDWQTLDQDITNSLALGAYDEEVEIRVTSNDAEPVIVEKTVEVVRVQTAAPITPEQLATLLPAASTTPASSSNSGLLIIIVIALIALLAVVVLRKKKVN
jgi:LPXTG-motif cell wall-anchored protein